MRLTPGPVEDLALVSLGRLEQRARVKVNIQVKLIGTWLHNPF